MVDATPFLPGLSPVQGKAVVVRFDGGRLSSEGGFRPLREVTRLGDITQTRNVNIKNIPATISRAHSYPNETKGTTNIIRHWAASIVVNAGSRARSCHE